MKHLLVLTLIATLMLPNALVYAQEASPSSNSASVTEQQNAPSDTTAATETVFSEVLQENTPDPIPLDLQATTTSDLQDTTNTQPAVTSDVLEGTVNPENTPSEETQVIPVEEAATTTAELPVEPDPVPAVPLEEATSTLDMVAQELVPEPEATPEPTPQAIALPEKDLTPDPQFAFALTGKSIPSKKIIKDREGRAVGEQTIANVAQTQIDNANGVISVSGQCSDVYFVILLYRNQNDYSDDPSSYLVNRAYPCVNGAYAYSIDELPHNLANGQYYLLVGQEGNTGTWTPITGLTEITINRN